ncbi:6,7-dimethyl-8-ribityllumazine synthase [Pelagibacterium xiamenense]|uniref:6,7-dimethyl-8-ribityllumazine synthase n=1 Tax=Pelagibacterium xiamenense TaxID=2901140 RepID=UPI001E501656|nr:6,7-dimethyl-8-ribityllumazine synthase [Pelagibacterium xiamenense]MCD7060791.1 6,7-dimethyl-8-ribityllumazine synthase [Pelagibacterium xiamenense]
MAASGDTLSIAPGSAKGQHYLIVEARFYSDLADALLEGATKAFEEAGASWDVVTVPGALEIPAAIAMASDLKGDKYDGYVALGCVIRGETTHYEIVSGESARALMDLSLADGIALGNGVLTVENENQAWVRARMSEQNKGGGAAVAAMTMAALKARFED